MKDKQIYKPLEHTPFSIVSYETKKEDGSTKTEYMVTTGNYILKQGFESVESAETDIKTYPWDYMIPLMSIVAEKVIRIQKK